LEGRELMSGPDAVAIPVLAGAALTQGISFLYGQAAEALRVRREGRLAHHTALVLPEAFEPLEAAALPDLAVLDVLARELQVLVHAAEPFTVRSPADLDGSDETLRGCFGRIREILEKIYGTRFTFVDERRPVPNVRQTIIDVHGSATGMKIRGTGARLDGSVVQQVETVHQGGELTGISFEMLPFHKAGKEDS
jgi:hypothetical protein